MKKRSLHRTAKARVARHRAKAAATGMVRVEVSAPLEDASLVKAVAETLRQGGTAAAELREALAPVMSSSRAKTGAELVAFLRSSPLRGANLVVERDRSPGRPVDLE